MPGQMTRDYCLVRPLGDPATVREEVMLRVLSVAAAVLLTFVVGASPAAANHSWNGYHWARTANPFALELGDNVSGAWDGMLATASIDWSKSNVLDTTIVAGGTRGKPCRPTSGRVEVCSASYGNNGWLGLAQIWITGGEHIVQGVVKNNDYYFGGSTYQYNNTAEMQHVICQEIGHTFGLDHQSTSGVSLNTCMDYYHNTSASDTKSTHPNQHDYDELATIYTHFDSFSSVGTAAARTNPVGTSGAGEDGTPIGASPERGSWYFQNLGEGRFLLTHVYWAPGLR
jgi:hypothetical protein